MGISDVDLSDHEPAVADRAPRTARTRAALALAVLSLLAAILGALGPAHEIRTTYTWPPRSMPTGTPAELWYTPLLLIRQKPESVSLRIPCPPPPGLAAAAQPATVVATARTPATSGGLAVTRAGDRLTVAVGTQVLAELEASQGAATDERCVYRIRLADNRWSIEGGPEPTSLSGDLGAMPVVSGLFSAVDLRAPRAPTIDVTTAVHDTRTTAFQTIAWLVAFAGLVAALLLLVGPAGPARMWAGVRDGLSQTVSHAHLPDAVVAITLVAWWIVGPVLWDDGWVVARERTFSASGGFSTYYDVFGVNLPLDYWVEWLHHWIAERTSVVLNLRLHALVAVGAMWVLCRWALACVTDRRLRPSGPAVWALASAFLVGALAWDMTIRPEPITALLATGVAVCAVRFAQQETLPPLAVAALLVPLALTAHHTGVVALAPVLAVSPRLLRWARGRLVAVGALVIASISWCVVLAFVGSDAGQRLADVRATSEFGITSPWRDELSRYVLVGEFPWATPLRRASVALIGLALLAFASRRRTVRCGLLDLPAMMLTLALVLFVVTPSKIAWHFGALTGLLALAVGAEVARLRDEAARSEGWQVRPYLVVAVVMASLAWSWSPRDAWNPVDLRTLAWVPGADAVLPFTTLAIAFPAVVLGGAMLVAWIRRRRFWSSDTAWGVAAWTAPMLAAPVILFTLGVLARDFQRTDGWTLTRQNLDSLVGRSDCGLGDDTVASLWASSRSLPSVDRGPTPAPPEWIPRAPVTGLPRFGLSPSSATPWFRLPGDGRLGLFVVGSGVAGGALQLDWGRQRDGRVDVLRSDVVGEIGARVETVPWTFVAASELPAPHPQADAVRIAAPPSVTPRAPVAVTAPVTYQTERLSRLLGDRIGAALIHPALFLYFPCARQPTLAKGIVEVPRYFVWFDHPFKPDPYEPTSPFLGVHDLYPVERLPLTDGPDPPAGVVVYDIDPQIPGAEVLSPDSYGRSS
jgi:hypothetical protein